MGSAQGISPALGSANPSIGEWEQINPAASIQPHGALLLLREPDGIIVQCSQKAGAFLGLQGDLLGTPLKALGGDLWALVRPWLGTSIDTIPVALRCHLGDPGQPFTALLHHPRGGGLVVEIERAGPPQNASAQIEPAIQAFLDASSLQSLCDEAAHIFKQLTGYDRAMV